MTAQQCIHLVKPKKGLHVVHTPPRGAIPTDNCAHLLRRRGKWLMLHIGSTSTKRRVDSLRDCANLLSVSLKHHDDPHGAILARGISRVVHPARMIVCRNVGLLRRYEMEPRT